MAATVEKDGNFDVVRAKNIFVESGVMARSIAVISDENTLAVTLGITDNGNGWVKTISAKGKALVELTSTVDDKGVVRPISPTAKGERLSLGHDSRPLSGHQLQQYVCSIGLRAINKRNE